MKKILAMLLAAVMLGLSVSAVVAENGDTLPTLANTSQLTVTEDGYVTGIGLDEEGCIIGYQFVNLGKMTDFIKKGDDPNTAYEKAKGQYGRIADAVKIIDPRKE